MGENIDKVAKMLLKEHIGHIVHEYLEMSNIYTKFVQHNSKNHQRINKSNQILEQQ